MNSSKYAIFWKYLDNSWLVSERGNGQFILRHDTAVDLCRNMNLKYKGKIQHWYVKEPSLLQTPEEPSLLQTPEEPLKESCSSDDEDPVAPV
jgi:hypothetical protein